MFSVFRFGRQTQTRRLAGTIDNGRRARKRIYVVGSSGQVHRLLV